MKKLLALCAVAALAVVTGCNNSPTGGNPTNSNDQFRLSGPSGTGPIAIKQAEKKDVKISVANKGKDFKDDVKLKVDAPKGLTVTPKDPVIKASEDSVTLNVEAASDAPTGKAEVHSPARRRRAGPRPRWTCRSMCSRNRIGSSPVPRPRSSGALGPGKHPPSQIKRQRQEVDAAARLAAPNSRRRATAAGPPGPRASPNDGRSRRPAA